VPRVLRFILIAFHEQSASDKPHRRSLCMDTVDGHLTSDPGSRESEHDARHYGRYGR
jgi:hypothetical protein